MTPGGGYRGEVLLGKRRDLGNKKYYIVGERAKRAIRYLLMSMESRDIYIYIRASVSNTHARMTYVCL